MLIGGLALLEAVPPLPQGPVSILLSSQGAPRPPIDLRADDEAHLPAEQAKARQDARLSHAHEDRRRPGDDQAPTRPRTQAALDLQVTAVAGAGVKRGRISRSADFDAAFRRGQSTSTRHLVVYAFERPDTVDPTLTRLGLAVSRRVGNAVVRNQVKRQLREAFARCADELPDTADFVVIARPSLPGAIEAQGFEWLVNELGQSARRSAERSG